MKASANRRVDAALGCDWTEGNPTGGMPGQKGRAPDTPPETGRDSDTATFSRQSTGQQNESDPLRDGNEELRRFLALLDYSNEKLEEMARSSLEPLKVAPRAVPSGIGMPLGDASARLKMADLKVGGVVQEYSAAVPAGCVIAQVPGPGSLAAKRSGVRLIVSKGPPPREEQHDVLRKRDKVPYHDRESRDGFRRAAPAAAAPVAGYTASGTVPNAPIYIPDSGDSE